MVLFISVILAISSCQKDRIKTKEISFDALNFHQDSCYAFLPNAFTPNGDYNNDAIRPILKGVKTEGFEFVIRNDSKKKIFTTTSLNESWDGADCPTGIYIGTLKGEFECGGDFEASCFVCLYTDCVSHPNPEVLEFESMFDQVTGQSVYSSNENICP